MIRMPNGNQPGSRLVQCFLLCGDDFISPDSAMAAAALLGELPGLKPSTPTRGGLCLTFTHQVSATSSKSNDSVKVPEAQTSRPPATKSESRDMKQHDRSLVSGVETFRPKAPKESRHRAIGGRHRAQAPLPFGFSSHCSAISRRGLRQYPVPVQAWKFRVAGASAAFSVRMPSFALSWRRERDAPLLLHVTPTNCHALPAQQSSMLHAEASWTSSEVSASLHGENVFKACAYH